MYFTHKIILDTEDNFWPSSPLKQVSILDSLNKKNKPGKVVLEANLVHQVQASLQSKRRRNVRLACTLNGHWQKGNNFKNSPVVHPIFSWCSHKHIKNLDEISRKLASNHFPFMSEWKINVGKLSLWYIKPRKKKQFSGNETLQPVTRPINGGSPWQHTQ